MTDRQLSVPSGDRVIAIPGLGAGGLSPQDVALPRLVLLQSNSKLVLDGIGAAGLFANTLTTRVYGAAIRIIPIVSFRNRVLLKMGEGLVCRSLDMEHGVGKPGGKCDVCPMQAWDNPENTKSRAPLCTVSHNWLVLVTGAPAELPDGKVTGRKASEATMAVEPIDPEVAILQWRMTATPTARMLNGLHMNAVIHSRTERGWHCREFTITAEQRQNDKGRFYVPKVALAGPSSEEQREFALSVAEALGGTELVFEPTPDDVIDPDGTSAVPSATTATANEQPAKPGEANF